MVRPTAARVAETGPYEVECPPPPPDRPRPRVPWVAAVAPVPVAVGLAVFLGPQLLAFALLGPFVLLATAAGDRWGSGRTRRRELEAHAAAVAAARTRLDLVVAQEATRLHRAHPDPHAVLTAAERRSAGLWIGGSRLDVRVGLGDVPTRVTWVEGSKTSRPVASRVPVVVDLLGVGCLAVVGPQEVTRRLLAVLVGQLCTTHPPQTLSVAVDTEDASWDWIGRMPHAVTIGDLLGTASDTPGPVRARDGEGSTGDGPGHRVLIVPDGGARMRALATRAWEAGVVVLIAVTSRALVPSGCRAVLAREEGDDRYVLDTGTGQVPVTPDLVGAWWSDRVSRALAPLRVRAGGTGATCRVA